MVFFRRFLNNLIMRGEIVVLLILFLLSGALYAQKASPLLKALQLIDSPTDFENMKDKLQDMSCFFFNPGADGGYPGLSMMKIGEMGLFMNQFNGLHYIIKFVDTLNQEFFCAQHIFLDGRTRTRKEIDSLRNIISYKYLEQGFSFDSLVLHYSDEPIVDLNKTVSNHIVKEYELLGLVHQTGDLFEVDVPQNNWYYLALKTCDNYVVQKHFYVYSKYVEGSSDEKDKLLKSIEKINRKIKLKKNR